MYNLLNNGVHFTRHLVRGRRLSSLSLAHKSLHEKIQSQQAPASNDVRQAFIDYFAVEHAHHFQPSSTVVPDSSDQSLLFVNAGMNQFKPIFLGQEPSLYKRVVNSQKCIRVGGKHCDLETVGRDFIHHTFFEMLGNWSFNDYFKDEACRMAWTLLTQIFRINPSRLFVTIFAGSDANKLQTDFETYEIWKSIGVPAQRIVPLGAKDNFWEMGKVGPCGVCTEIHYILDSADVNNLDSILKNSVEIWNIVFIQYFRDEEEKLHRLDKNYIDTGMGLERILSILQCVPNNYATDLFLPYFDRLSKTCRWPHYSGKLSDTKDISYRILADHSRMAAVAIADHVQPDDRGAGYLLRRVLRRAIEALRANSEIQKLPDGLNEADVLKELAQVSIETLGAAFPELEKESSLISKVIEDEVRLYCSAITRNTHLMGMAKTLEIQINENARDNEARIVKKLNEMQEDLEEARTEIMVNHILDHKQLDDCRKELHVLTNLTSNEPVLSHRFGLSNAEIEDSLKRLDIEMTTLENDYHSMVESVIQQFEVIARRNLYQDTDYSVLMLDRDHLSDYKQIDELLMKISLDLFGEKPLATMIAREDSNCFTLLLQMSVPNEYHKKLTAEAWFEQAWSLTIDHFDTLDIKIEPIKTKRTKKNIKFRFKLYDCDDDKSSSFVHMFTHNCKEIANLFSLNQ